MPPDSIFRIASLSCSIFFPCQNALNTTAHNLTNTETTGYVRQQVQQSTRSYLQLSVDVRSVNNKQVGLGVTYSRVKHIRDYFLDKIYRRESGRSMFYEVSTEVMEEICAPEL